VSKLLFDTLETENHQLVHSNVIVCSPNPVLLGAYLIIICPSACMKQPGSHWMDFDEI
jgi:hypothetical protein